LLLLFVLSAFAATSYWLLAHPKPTQTATRQRVRPPERQSTPVHMKDPANAADPLVSTNEQPDATEPPLGDDSTDPQIIEGSAATSAEDDSGTTADPKFDALITLEFERDGRKVVSSYDQIQ